MCWVQCGVTVSVNAVGRSIITYVYILLSLGQLTPSYACLKKRSTTDQIQKRSAAASDLLSRLYQTNHKSTAMHRQAWASAAPAPQHPILCSQQQHSKRWKQQCASHHQTAPIRLSQHQQQQQDDRSSTLLAAQIPTNTHYSSRRSALLAGTSSLLLVGALCCNQPAAQAYLVDETAAQSVFALASRSVVSINDYRNQAGAELLEGIGTGFVWDQYGHGKRRQTDLTQLGSCTLPQ